MMKSFWIAGFEGSCHRRRDGKRLDLLAATKHDRFAGADYRRLRQAGIGTARDGVRWHLVEPAPGRYDFSSLLPQVRAARDAGVQVIWSLCHYGYPDGLDPFRPAFVDRFARFARVVARVIASETDEAPFYTPINEISFWSWAGADVAYFNPGEIERGFELKAQLVRASLAATDAIWEVDRRARMLYTDPSIHIVPDPERAADDRAAAEAEGHRLAQFQAWDMLGGKLWPQLGGEPRYLDLLGVNYYPRNQWVLHGPTVERGSPWYRPFREILTEVYQRYRQPILISETGTHAEERPEWLAYICDEVRAAGRAGVPVRGICLYPVLDYPSWDHEHPCPCGLWGFPDAEGNREIFQPLAREIAHQTELFRRERAFSTLFDPDPAASGLHASEPGVEEIEHAAC
jgi:hypothetical protein